MDTALIAKWTRSTIYTHSVHAQSETCSACTRHWLRWGAHHYDAEHDEGEVVLHSREVAQEEACPHKHEGPQQRSANIVGPKPEAAQPEWAREAICSGCSMEHLAMLSGQEQHRLCIWQAAQPCHEMRTNASMSAKHAASFHLMQGANHGGYVYSVRWSALGIWHAAHARHEGCKGAHNRHKARQYHRFAAVLPVEVLCLPDEVLRHSMAGSYLLLYCLVQCSGWQPGSWGGTVVQEMTHLANKPALDCLGTCADTSVTGSFHGDSHRDFRISGVECCLS